MATPLWMSAGRGPIVGTATIAAAGDLCTIVAHGLIDGQQVLARNLTGGASALVADVPYFVANATADTFQLRPSPGGPVMEFATDGGADVHEVAGVYDDQSLRDVFAGFIGRGDLSGGFTARPGVLPNASEAGHVVITGTSWTVADLIAVVQHSTGRMFIVPVQSEGGSTVAADGTNPRIDAIDLQVRYDPLDASGSWDYDVVYVTGTPASTPTAPTITANSERLSSILVPAGGTPSPSIDEKPRFTVMRGGATPVMDDAHYPGSGGRHKGQLLYNIEKNQLIGNTNAGAAWSVLAVADGFQLLDRIVYTSSSSFDKTAYPGIRAVHIEVQGAGGGGGGTNATGAGAAGVGGGGGGGEYRRGWILDGSLSDLTTVTVGAGGSGGPNGSSNGGSGGTSSFGSHVSSSGGTGGNSNDVGTGHLIATGGNGGAGGLGGYLTIPGDDGGNGYRGGGFVSGGLYGGASAMGGSQRGNGTTAGGNGGAGQSFGGGGAAGHNNQSQASSRSGGAGGQGVVVVEIYG